MLRVAQDVERTRFFSRPLFISRLLFSPFIYLKKLPFHKFLPTKVNNSDSYLLLFPDFVSFFSSTELYSRSLPLSSLHSRCISSQNGSRKRPHESSENDDIDDVYSERVVDAVFAAECDLKICVSAVCDQLAQEPSGRTHGWPTWLSTSSQ